jgi:dihydropyrimidine dehydrogenase (NAD+) subunit PreA
MEPLVNAIDRRTGRLVDGSYANWTQHPNNPMSAAARKLEPAEPAE